MLWKAVLRCVLFILVCLLCLYAREACLPNFVGSLSPSAAVGSERHRLYIYVNEANARS